MSRSLAMLTVVALGCAGRRLPRSEVDQPPIWSTREGRDDTRVELAEALIDANAPEAALEMIAGLRADGATSSELDRVHSRALREVGLFDDAQDVLNVSLRRHSRDGALYNELGILQMDRQEVTEAIRSFESATRYTPDNADFQNNLGFARMSGGDAEGALVPLRAALKIDSTSRQTRNNLGFALAALGRDKEAWRVFRASTSEADAHYNLGLSRELRGDPTAARDAYISALKVQPDHRSATDALARLAAGPQPEVPHAPTP